MELLKGKTKRNKDNDKNNNIINEMIIEYINKEKKKIIKLFGKYFINNNINKCKIIIENKEQDIIEYLNVNKNDKILKIKLKEIKTITNMSHMFHGCKELVSLPNISNWNTNNVTNMRYMFSGCSSLTSLPDISNWNINNVTDMSNMFSGCSSLISLPDISNWNTNNVTLMSFMFSGCSSLTTLPDTSNWKFKKNNNTFYRCNSLPLKYTI